MTTPPASPPSPVESPIKSPLVRRRELDLSGRRIVLVDLPRVDANSLAQLREVLAREKPTALAVELDEQRRHWLEDRESWEKTDLLEILRKKKGRLLNSYLALRIFQKRFGSFDGCEPGDEMLAAMEEAKSQDLPVHLVDRDMKITALRAWRLTPSWFRPRLAMAMTAGSFRRTRPREEAEEPDELRRRLERVGRSMPVAHRAFIDERNLYMAQTIASIDADHVFVVLSTAHADAVFELLGQGPPAMDLEVHQIPERTLIARAMPWLFSVAIIALFIVGLIYGDAQTLQDAVLAWGVINAGMTALFTIAALAHPVAIIAAALSAPVVSLNPAMGAGGVGAIVQAFLVPPNIEDIEGVGDDIARLSGWWTNRLARLVLIFVFANLGSTIGTFIALALFPEIFG